MSTAFFLGFDEEYSEGLALPSDVFDQLFAETIGRSRGCTGGSSGGLGLDPSSIDELTGNSLGEIDNHALLADNIGVDIVGRSNGAHDAGRNLGSSNTFMPSPAGDGMLRATTACTGVSNAMLPLGGLNGRSVESLLGLPQDAFGCAVMSTASVFHDLSAPSSFSLAVAGDPAKAFHYSFATQPGMSASNAFSRPPNVTPSTIPLAPPSSSSSTSIPSSSSTPAPGVDSPLGRALSGSSRHFTPLSSIGERFVTSIPSRSASAAVAHAEICGPTSQSSPVTISLCSSPANQPSTSKSLATASSLARTTTAGMAGKALSPGLDRSLPPSRPEPIKTVMTLQPKKKRVRNRTRPAKPKEPLSLKGGTGTPVKGGWPKGKPRSCKRQSGEPRPLVSSWQCFISEQFRKKKRTQFDLQLATTTNMKELAAQWHSLSEEEKKVYEGRAAEDKIRYVKELAEFEKSPEYSEMLEEKVQERFGSDRRPLPSELVETLKTSSEVQNSKDLCCTLCNLTFLTQHNHEEHLVGKKHKQNIKTNAASTAQRLVGSPTFSEDASLGQKAEAFMAHFYHDNRVRDLEIQELKTQQAVAQVKATNHQETISGLKARQAAVPHRSQVLEERNYTVQRRLDRLQAILTQFGKWSPPQRPSSSQASVASTSSPVSVTENSSPGLASFPCTPGTPVTSASDTLLQKSLAAFPSPPPSSGPSSCAAAASSSVEMRMGSMLADSVCSFSCQSPDRCWTDMQAASERDAERAVVAGLSLEDVLNPVALHAGGLCSVTSAASNGLSSSVLFSLANAMHPGLPLSSEKDDALLLPSNATTSPLTAGLSWSDWLPSTDLSAST